MLRFDTFEHRRTPFPYWVSGMFIAPELVQEINEQWPLPDDAQWFVERAGYVKKAAWMFPRRLPVAAHCVAEKLYGEESLVRLSDMMGIELLPDPWFVEGPMTPRVGGGLHEIGTGGHLGVHLDFDAHPTGLTRAANLLIYLNRDWQDEWGGHLELHGERSVARIAPHGGCAVLFETNGRSWHGHPEPLRCPQGRTRRSLALYYYRKADAPQERRTTVYR